MYPNLRAEMARKNIRLTNLAEALDISYDSASNKTNGKTDFTRSEIFKLQKAFFPDLTLEYLFETKEIDEEEESI